MHCDSFTNDSLCYIETTLGFLATRQGFPPFTMVREIPILTQYSRCLCYVDITTSKLMSLVKMAEINAENLNVPCFISSDELTE